MPWSVLDCPAYARLSMHARVLLLEMARQYHRDDNGRMTDEKGRAILLTQPADNYDEPGTVLIHPWQLRAVCEQFGIIASDPQAAKTITTLTRRLHLLRDRIDFLAAYLANHSDSKHADLSFEQTYARATADIADEFCAELVDAVTPSNAACNVTAIPTAVAQGLAA